MSKGPLHIPLRVRVGVIFYAVLFGAGAGWASWGLLHNVSAPIEDGVGRIGATVWHLTNVGYLGWALFLASFMGYCIGIVLKMTSRAYGWLLALSGLAGVLMVSVSLVWLIILKYTRP